MNTTIFITELPQETQNNIKEYITNQLKSEYNNVSIEEILENCMNDRLCNIVDNEYIFEEDVKLWFNGYLIHEITIDMGAWVKVAIKLDYETTNKLASKYWKEAYELGFDIADYFLQFGYELILLEEC